MKLPLLIDKSEYDLIQNYLRLDIESTANGWQPFHVRKASDPKPQDAVMCPSSKEANRVSSCEACKLCDGSKLPVSIIAH